MDQLVWLDMIKQFSHFESNMPYSQSLTSGRVLCNSLLANFLSFIVEHCIHWAQELNCPHFILQIFSLEKHLCINPHISPGYFQKKLGLQSFSWGKILRLVRSGYRKPGGISGVTLDCRGTPPKNAGFSSRNVTSCPGPYMSQSEHCRAL